MTKNGAKNDVANLPWERPGWRERVRTWIQLELEQRELGITGAIEQVHVRPWSTVLRVPTRAGAVYFKASAPDLAHEPAVTESLSRWRPDDLPTVLAADPERGWLLMVDGGTRLREVLAADRDLRHWEDLLPRYAELQIDVAGRLGELLKHGIPDRRLASLPERYRRLLDDTEALRIDLPDGIDSVDYGRLRELEPRLAELSARLAASAVPESIHHGDLHDGNIFVRNGHYTLFDWGDGSVSHPFFSLRTAFVSLENTLQIEEGAPEISRLRDAYLEPWTRYASPGELLTTFDLAQRLSPFISALSWYQSVSLLEPSLKKDYAHAVPSLLQEFLGAVA